MSSHRKMIGIIAKSFDGSFNGTIMAGITHALEQHNYGAIAIQYPWTQKSSLYNEPLGLDLADGWIVMNESADPDFFRAVYELQKPIVSINRTERSVPCTSIIVDNVQGMYLSTEHLIQHGHKQIAFIGDLTNPNIRRRFEGYKKALQDYSLPYHEDLTVNTATSAYVGTFAATAALLDKVGQFTAYVSASDVIANAFKDELCRAGYSVPDDVAAFGFNNDINARMGQIATVQLPAFELGEKAVEALARKFDGEALDQHETVMLPCSLIPRQSCGCSPTDIAEGQSNDIEDESDLHIESEPMMQLMEQFRSVNYDLSRDHQLDLRRVSRILNMQVSCLAFWRYAKGGERQLQIDSYYDGTQSEKQLLGMLVRGKQFPPLLHFFHDVPGTPQKDIAYIHLLRTEHSDYGVLAFAGSFPKGTQQLIGVTLISMLAESISSNMDLDLLLNETNEQKNLYQAMAQQLSTITETTSDGIWVMDVKDGHIQWYNNRIHDILGIEDASLTDSPRKFINHVHPSDKEIVWEKFSQHLRTKEPFHIVCRLMRADGTYIWTATHVKALSQDKDDFRVIGSIQDITQSKLADEQIQYLAYHDALTGLLNRRAFVEKLEESIAESAANDEKLALLLVDLDRFKMVNDSYGHHVGDRVLIEAAQRLRGHLPRRAVFCRLGGDEFTIMLPQMTQREEVARLGQKIISSFIPSFHYDGHEFHIGGSVGISIYPDDGVDMATLMKNADIAMRRAKDNGKNQMEWYSPEMHIHSLEWLTVENGLVKALQQEEFVLHYQPQIDVMTGKLFGAEALVRWYSEERGLVPPLQFIPVAEETGLIVPIGEWILREACLQLRRWSEKYEFEEGFLCSVNISARQFEQHHFTESVRAIIKETGVDPKMICLEITESMAINDVEFYIHQMNELLELGIRLALDDFGTGYSSLDILRRLPIHLVKIDRTFTQNMKTDRDDLAIVQGIISLSHNLDKEVIAEGVEYEEQKELLIQAGCDYCQGFYISKPMEAQLFEQTFLLSK